MAAPAPRILRTLLTAIALITVTPAGTAAQTAGQTFRWAGDPEGGAPYVEASPDNPDLSLHAERSSMADFVLQPVSISAARAQMH